MGECDVVTKEEIHEKAVAIDKEYGIDISISVLHEFGCELVAQAYEEAAERGFRTVKIIDQQDYSTLQKAASVAATIRALKDSLDA